MDEFWSIEEMEVVARRKLTPNTLQCFQGGMERGDTIKENTEAYRRIQLIPRALVNIRWLNVNTTLLGEPIDMPIAVGPTGYHKLAHPDGELASSRGAARMNTCYVLPTPSTVRIADVAAASGGLKWHLLYLFKDLQVVRSLVKLAEEGGFKAIVVTVDTPMPHYQRKPRRIDLPPGVRMEVFLEVGLTAESNSLEFIGGQCLDESRSWESFKWLTTITTLPVVAKGIMNTGDALLAWKHGAKGIIVSNHGGRNLDTVPASIDVLEDIVSVVGDKLEVYMDGGIRYGSDVFKALALGARAVFVGRPTLWALSCGGEDGVVRMLELLKEGLEHNMAFTGCRSLSDITKSCIVKTQSAKL